MEALAPQEAVDCGQNAGARGSHPCPASWLRIRGSEISHLESEDRCLHGTLTSTSSATRFGWGPAPPGRPRGSPSFHQARYNGRLKPCSTCNRVKGKITPRQQGRSQLGDKHGWNPVQPQKPCILTSGLREGPLQTDLLHLGLGFSGTAVRH